MQRIKFRTAHKNFYIGRVLVSHLIEGADGRSFSPSAVSAKLSSTSSGLSGDAMRERSPC